MREQLKLAGIPAPESHANRGRQFEAILEATHEYYLRAGIGYVEKISNKWVYCSEGEWRGLAPALKARDGNNRPMKRAATMCDYLGHARGSGVAFDAKEFKDASFPLVNVKPHQATALFNFYRTGGLGGFLLWSRRVDKVYWVNAETMMIQRQAGTVKSLNIKWLDEHATLITEKASGATVDWARVLLPPRAA
jgi:recombination protein U